MQAAAALNLLLLVLAWCVAAMVRPWRLLQGGALATPLLGALVVLPWLWAWPGLAALPVPLQWSGAPLLVLLLGWPLAIPLLTLAGLSTIVTTGAGWQDALALTVWSGLLPATLVLALGQAVRKAAGHHPVGYLLGRAFLVPLVALAACSLLAAATSQGPGGFDGELHRPAVLLLAMGEAAWTCAAASLLVAYRPRWLATWSDALYLGRPVRVRVRAGSGGPPAR